MGRQGVVLVQVAEGGLRAPLGVRRRRRPVAAGVDAGLRPLAGHAPPPSSVTQPGLVFPRLGPCPLGMATELPGTGVALAQGSPPSASAGSGAAAPAATGSSPGGAPIASTTSPSAWKLCPLTSASQYGSAATMPPARTAKPAPPALGLTQTIRYASRDRRAISRPTSAGSPRSQPSERITTTAPLAMPRRP